MKLTGENLSTRGKKPVPVPLCPPQIPHGLTPVLHGERPATNVLSHGTVSQSLYFPKLSWHGLTITLLPKALMARSHNHFTSQSSPFARRNSEHCLRHFLLSWYTFVVGHNAPPSPPIHVITFSDYRQLK
jgi:hypothetical protein